MSRGLRITSGCLITAIVAVVPTLAFGAAPPSLKGSSGPLTVTMTPAPPSRPKINTNYDFTVTATLSGKPAHATALYKFLVFGVPVSTQYPGKNTHSPLHFTGHYSDFLNFPKAALGHPLTFELVVTAAGHTVNLQAPVTAQK